MTEGAAPTRNPAVQGIAFMVLAVFLFSFMDMLVKLATETLPIGQILFARNFFAFIPVLWMVRRAGGFGTVRTHNYRGHLFRSVIGLGAMTCFFLSYRALPLGEAVALASAGTIFMTALSVPLLGERVGPRRWTAVFLGFVGVLVMTRPGIGVFDPGALYAIGGATCYALAMISIRHLTRTESSIAIVFHFTLILTLAGALTLPFVFKMPTLPELALLVGIGLVGGTAQFAMIGAFRRAPIGLIAPFDYLALVFAMVFGYLVWDDLPDAFLIVGASIVVASGLYILHREARLKTQALDPPPHP